MYNESLKNEYIEYKEFNTVMPTGYLRNVFEKTGVFEERFSKDVMDFTKEEIVSFYKSIRSGSIQRFAVLNSTLALYKKWCNEKCLSVCGDNPFYLFDNDDFIDFTDFILKDERYFNKCTIYDMIDCLENPGEQFFLLALYEGISGTNLCELVDLRTTDIHGNTITLRNAYKKSCNLTRDIIVSDRLIELAYKAANEEMYYKFVKSRSADYKCKPIRFIKDDTLILKNLPNTKSDVSEIQLAHRLSEKLKRIKFIYGVDKLTCTDIINSGKVNFIKEHALALNMTPKSYLFSDEVNIMNEQFGRDIIRSRFYRENKSFLNRVA